VNFTVNSLDKKLDVEKNSDILHGVLFLSFKKIYNATKQT